MTTLKQHSANLAAGKISSVELTKDYLSKISLSEHNAFISITSELALQQAEAADIARNKGNNDPLLGVPIAHKDIFCIDGTQTTCGSKMLEKFIAPYTSTVVERLNQAGTIVLGKTNMDEFAMGSSNENSFFGDVINPWSSASSNSTLVPGGSSGGSAAAVAADLAPATTGTDTGGSIRQPAAFCGLTGVKPSYGRCSRYGMVAFASSLDQAGPITHTAEDAAMMLTAMSGFDPRDSTSLDIPREDFSTKLDNSIEGLKIGLPTEFFSDGLDNDIAIMIERAIKTYTSLGATFTDISLPNAERGLASYYVIAPAEASSNLSRFDGTRYGFRAAKYDDLDDLYTQTRTQGFGAEVKRRIMIGTYALSSGYYDAYYAKAQKVRRLISNDFTAAFESVDIILGPTTPTPAFEHDSLKNDPVSMYLNDIYTIPVSLAGLPAASIPCGLTSSGLPAGLQLISPYLQESRLLNVAHKFQQETDFHKVIAPSIQATQFLGEEE